MKNLQYSSPSATWQKIAPMHPSQQILSNEECIISLHIKPNKEFEAQLFSYGPQVEVLQPAWLREQLIQKIEENLRKYKTV